MSRWQGSDWGIDKPPVHTTCNHRPLQTLDGAPQPLESPAMSRLRMFLAWLLLLAIPLQGLAAASMLHCGSGSGAAAESRTAAGPYQHSHHGDQALAESHDLSHQHAGHDHAADGVDSAGGGSTDAGTLPDAGHKCSVCAACCHGAAISDTAGIAPAAAAPQAVRVEPFVAVHSRPGSVPDKPPRA